MSLVETFRYHSEVLQSQSGALEIIQHAGERGMAREDLLEEFLSPRLPDQHAIGRGEIKSADDEWSRQEDLIIYDRLRCPRLFVGERTQLFPAESVAAVIEIKTTLNSQAIEDASRNIAEARSLEVGEEAIPQAGPNSLSFGSPHPIFGALFAYDRELSAETFIERWNEQQFELPPQKRINLACILGDCVILHVDQTFHLWDQTSEDNLNDFAFLDLGEDSLLAFTLALLRVLSEYRYGHPDLFQHVFSEEEAINADLGISD